MQSILMAIVSIAIIGLLGAFIARSRYGVAIRAVAQDLDAARLMAVPVRGMFPIVMGFALTILALWARSGTNEKSGF